VPAGFGAHLSAPFGTRPAAGVIARHVFYNNSAADGRDPAPNAADDAAIAAGKQALLGGYAGSIGSVTNYTRGINGIMIDVYGGLSMTALAGIGGGAGLKVGTNANPATWRDAPRPTQITIRPAAGIKGSDRITLVWADGAIKNTWLQVSLSTAGNGAGLTAPDVFYFGNLVGESDVGGQVTPAVDTVDLMGVRRATTYGATASLTRFDFNRDGKVDAADVMAVRANLGRTLSLFNPPAVAASGAGAAAAVGMPVAGAREGRAVRRSAWEELGA
jgi:hypothetical protein